MSKTNYENESHFNKGYKNGFRDAGYSVLSVVIMLIILWIVSAFLETCNAQGITVNRKWYFDQQEVAPPDSDWELISIDTTFALPFYNGGDGASMFWTNGAWTISGGKATYDGTNLKSIIWDSLYAVPSSSINASNIYFAPGDSMKIQYELEAGTSIQWKLTMNDQGNSANLIFNNWNYPTETAEIYEKLDVNDSGVYLTKGSHLCLTSTGGSVLWYKIWRKEN